MNANVLIFLCLSLFFNAIQSARILGVFPSPSRENFVLCEKLMTELVNRGHELTLISAFEPACVGNCSTILIDELEINKDVLLSNTDENPINHLIAFYNKGFAITQLILKNIKVQSLLCSNQTFDLVIVEKCGNEAHLGFAKHFNAPLVVFSPIGLAEWNSHLVGNLRLPSVVPISATPYTNRMSFVQRLSNTLVHLVDIFYKIMVCYPKQQQFLYRYFPRRMSLGEVLHNASLLLLNSHVAVTGPMSLTNSVVEIGGFHITSGKLPLEIQIFLDEAQEGAVFVNLNLNISSNLTEELFGMFLGLKQSVLWKIDNKIVRNETGKVLVSDWLCQTAILEHKNVVGLINNGDLLGNIEAVFHGVPTVGIPLFSEQKINVARAVQNEISVHLPFTNLTANNLRDALDALLNDAKYKSNAEKYSTIFKDQLVKPSDLAIYWIEYVLRHKGASHLKNPSSILNWFQLYLFDVLFFVLFFLACIYYLFKLVLVVIKLLFGKLNDYFQKFFDNDNDEVYSNGIVGNGNINRKSDLRNNSYCKKDN